MAVRWRHDTIGGVRERSGVIDGPRPRTILEGLARNASHGGNGWIFSGVEGTEHLTLDRLHEEASARANELLGRGVQPRDAVGVLGPNAPDWIEWAAGGWTVGATLCPVS